jgi:hypothetical protein
MRMPCVGGFDRDTPEFHFVCSKARLHRLHQSAEMEPLDLLNESHRFSGEGRWGRSHWGHRGTMNTRFLFFVYARQCRDERATHGNCVFQRRNRGGVSDQVTGAGGSNDEGLFSSAIFQRSC